MGGLGPLLNSRGGHSPHLEGEECDEPGRVVSCGAAEAARLFVLGHSDFANTSAQIDSRVAAGRSDTSIASVRVKSSDVNIASSVSRRCPEANQTRAVRQ